MNRVLRDYRAGLGISQTELAKKAKLSLNTVYLAENGKTMPHARSIYRLAKALNVDPRQLSQDLRGEVS